MKLRRFLPRALLAFAVLTLALQLVPYGRGHSNPPRTAEPPWDSAETRALAQRACFDCHSNEVRWPWYSHVAPVSWLVQHDVDEGRAVLNFSEWSRPQAEASESAEAVREGEMPPRLYPLLHASARLTTEERARLAAGLSAALGEAHEGEGEQEEHDGDDELLGLR